MVLTHAIFSGPFPVTLDLKEIDTPENYFDYYQPTPLPNRLQGWKVHEPFKNEDGRKVYGSVAVGVGFADTPDTEVISGGVNTKASDWVAIGRHANFLMWGFAATPKHMTPSGREVFANAIVYMTQFDHQRPFTTRRFTGRDWWINEAYQFRNIGTDYAETKKRYEETAERMKEEERVDWSPPEELESLEKYTEKNAKRLFPKLWEQYGGDDLNVYLDVMLENRDYLRAKGDWTYNSARIDEDVAHYQIPNYDPKLLEHCIGLLEKKEDMERAQRVLERYTDLTFESVAGWRAWFNEAREGLFFSDSGGYRFFSTTPSAAEITQRLAQEPAPALDNQNPVSVTAHLILDAGSSLSATIVVRFQVAELWHLYDTVPEDHPNRPTVLSTELPDLIEALGDWERPPSHASLSDGRLQIWEGDVLFQRRVRAQQPADFDNGIDVEVSYQVCTDSRCQPPHKVTLSATKRSDQQASELPK